MKTQTKTFKRFIRKVQRNHMPVRVSDSIIKSFHKLYIKGGKIAVLNHLGLNTLQLPPSMPKNAASKIANYDDTRKINGIITILLKNNFIFPFNDSSLIEVHNVKEAISIMRTVQEVK